MQLNGKGFGWMILRQVTGYLCLVAGIIGCILPVIPGVPFLIAGLGLLAVDAPWAARLRDWLLAKVRAKKSKVPEREQV